MNPSRFDQNHFALLGLSPDFQIDLNQLDMARQRVQAVVHPDRFASAGPAQKRLALQWSTRIHEAYETLREPLKRATYLLALKGISVDAEQNTRMPLAFLEQQMEWREALDDHADDLES
ncbi:MAG: Fe-S protein assembly co-chaperone HscB, partial [Burkholderiaceae bacterium]